MDKQELIKEFVSTCHSTSEENIDETVGKVRFMIDLLIQEGVYSKLDIQNKSLMARVEYNANVVDFLYKNVAPNHHPLPSIYEQ